MPYFTAEHFELLKRWGGHKREKENLEQDQAIEKLKEAYLVTEQWAHLLKDVLCPYGRVEILKKPTTQANTFADYNWARIYPTTDSPKVLAYTVGIEGP